MASRGYPPGIFTHFRPLPAECACPATGGQPRLAMIDHILLDVIAALREAFEGALLEQQAVEERFQVDVFLGDVAFETSYSLPGEDSPPRVRADLSPDWPTGSQAAGLGRSAGPGPSRRSSLSRSRFGCSASPRRQIRRWCSRRSPVRGPSSAPSAWSSPGQ